MSKAKVEDAPRHPVGAQTLARGLTALQLVAEAPGGLTVREVAEQVGVHRTVAYRILLTLAEHRLVVRQDTRYRPAAGLAMLGASFDRGLRELSAPVLRALADELRTTVSLLVAEGGEQVAISVIVPAGVAYQLSFHEGSRYPLERGSAGVALLAARPARAGERDLVTETRERGWVMTYGEVEPQTYGLAVPVARPEPLPAVCINVISHRADVVERSVDTVVRAATELSKLLA